MYTFQHAGLGAERAWCFRTSGIRFQYSNLEERSWVSAVRPYLGLPAPLSGLSFLSGMVAAVSRTSPPCGRTSAGFRAAVALEPLRLVRGCPAGLLSGRFPLRSSVFFLLPCAFVSSSLLPCGLRAAPGWHARGLASWLCLSALLNKALLNKNTWPGIHGVEVSSRSSLSLFWLSYRSLGWRLRCALRPLRSSEPSSPLQNLLGVKGYYRLVPKGVDGACNPAAWRSTVLIVLTVLHWPSRCCPHVLGAHWASRHLGLRASCFWACERRASGALGSLSNFWAFESGHSSCSHDVPTSFLSHGLTFLGLLEPSRKAPSPGTIPARYLDKVLGCAPLGFWSALGFAILLRPFPVLGAFRPLAIGSRGVGFSQSAAGASAARLLALGQRLSAFELIHAWLYGAYRACLGRRTRGQGRRTRLLGTCML